MFLPFEAARTKLSRAGFHIDDLENQIQVFFARENAYVAFEMAEDYTRATGFETSAFVYRQKTPIPPVWSAIVGDAIHNMRSALDLIASDLHGVTGGRPEDTAHVYYPFCKDQSALHQTIRSRRLSGIGRDFIKFIEQTAPYKGGNNGLRALHDLDILDKHQRLVTTISVVQMDWPVPITDGSKFWSGIAQDGQKLIIFPRAFAPNISIGAKIRSEFLVVFGDVGFFAGREVIKQLKACMASIGVIVDGFARLWEQRVSGQ